MKLLHERLNDYTEHFNTLNRIQEQEGVIHTKELLEHFAEEIERDYIQRDQHEREMRELSEAQHDSAHHIMKQWASEKGMPLEDGQGITKWLDKWFIPRPRFDDGEPVQFDDRLDCGYVRGITFNSDKNINYRGRFGIILDNDTRLYKVGELVKRPQPKVYDADGMRIYKEDEGWYISSLIKDKPSGVKVIDIDADANKLFVRDDDGNEYWIIAKKFTRKEPDSLRKVFQDMMNDINMRGRSYPNRILALIERGA